MRAFRPLTASLLALFCLAGAARAEFAVCNQSFDVVNVAIGQDVSGEFQTEGSHTPFNSDMRSCVSACSACKASMSCGITLRSCASG